MRRSVTGPDGGSGIETIELQYSPTGRQMDDRLLGRPRHDCSWIDDDPDGV